MADAPDAPRNPDSDSNPRHEGNEPLGARVLVMKYPDDTPGQTRGAAATATRRRPQHAGDTAAQTSVSSARDGRGRGSERRHSTGAGQCAGARATGTHGRTQRGGNGRTHSTANTGGDDAVKRSECMAATGHTGHSAIPRAHAGAQAGCGGERAGAILGTHISNQESGPVCATGTKRRDDEVKRPEGMAGTGYHVHSKIPGACAGAHTECGDERADATPDTHIIKQESGSVCATPNTNHTPRVSETQPRVPASHAGSASGDTRTNIQNTEPTDPMKIEYTTPVHRATESHMERAPHTAPQKNPAERPEGSTNRQNDAPQKKMRTAGCRHTHPNKTDRREDTTTWTPPPPEN